MKIRKHLWLFTPLFCFIFVFSLCLSTLLAKADDSINELTVGVPVDRCPIFYIDNEGQVTGIGVDLMKVAADNSGYKLSFVPIKEKTIKEALDNESYDIILPFGSAIKSEMGKSIVVSDNLFELFPFFILYQYPFFTLRMLPSLPDPLWFPLLPLPRESTPHAFNFGRSILLIPLSDLLFAK